MIKSLLGLLSIQAGSAEVLGFRLPQQLRAIRDSVGYLPEDDCYIAGLTGIESVQFMARLSGLQAVEGLRRSHEVLDFSDIGQERYRKVESYSTGMRQKLKFAQAIVHDPRLLILDEPTSGLDPGQRVAMLRKIKTLASRHGKSILISTHILHDVREVCEQVIIMAAGQVRLTDSLENLSRPTEVGVTLQVERTRQPSLQQPFPDADHLVEQLRQHACQGVWQVAREYSVNIRQLSTARNSLESVFFQAVKEAQHASA